MNPAQHILVAGLRMYQAAISPLLAALFGAAGCGCRFHPTCSRYAVEAIRKHGALKGSVLTTWRLCRCQPFGGHGEDPVPDTFGFTTVKTDDRTRAPGRPSSS